MKGQSVKFHEILNQGQVKGKGAKMEKEMEKKKEQQEQDFSEN